MKRKKEAIPVEGISGVLSRERIVLRNTLVLERVVCTGSFYLGNRERGCRERREKAKRKRAMRGGGEKRGETLKG